MVDETLRTAFASRGLTLNEQTGHERPFAIAGETFRVKEFIKQAGGRWSREEQCWRLASAGELARLASLIAGDAGGPHVVRDVIGSRELDAGDEGRLFGIGDIEDFEPVPFAVIAAPP